MVCEGDYTPVTLNHGAAKVIFFSMKRLRFGKDRATGACMKNSILTTVLLMLSWPMSVHAANQQPDTNVNSRYTVESVEVSGVAESKISKALHDDMQKMVGEKYNQDAAHKLADRLRKELTFYSVEVKVKRGDKPDCVKVIFEAERTWWKRFEIAVPPVVYESKEGLSYTFDLPIDFRHASLIFGLTDSADELLERNTGIRLGFEDWKLGTDRIQLRVDFDSYHQTFNQATQVALATASNVPGVYRERQDFAPALSVIPWHDLKLSIGTSFERFQIQYPQTHTQTAYAGTAGIQFRHIVRTQSHSRHDIRATYSLRTATRALSSDYVYARHFATVDYTVSKGRNLFGVHLQGGLITGTAPLFERFSLGNSLALRGWNKFDVAPLGGTRLAYGSLEYRYRPFQFFYDVGTVYDPGRPAQVRHGLGVGIATKDGFFASLAVPVRLHNVVPMFMLGFRF
jgi:outer membrane translocation and assembly module TamA